MVERTRLPGLGPQPTFEPPAFTRQRLANGVDVWTSTHRQAPVLTLRLLVPTGSADDPPDQSGLASLTADLLDDGTVDLSDVALDQALTRIGAHLGIGVSSDTTVLSMTTLAKHARDAFSLLVEVVARPRFAADECHRVRDLRLARIRQMRQVPSAVADRVFLASLYGDHPYGHLTIGREDDVRRLGAEDVPRFHRHRYGPASWTLVAVGDLPGDELVGLADATLGEVHGTSFDPVELAGGADDSRVPEPPPLNERLVFIPREQAVQSEIRLGHAGVSRRSDDYHALLVLNMVLGGQFVSRINLNLREDKGYTYGAHTAFDWRVGRGPFSFSSSVQTSATADSILEVVSEIDAIRDSRPATDQELSVARAALTRGFPRSFETAAQIARVGTTLARHGLPPDETARFVDRIMDIDAESVTRVARAHLHPDRMLAVVVGSRADVPPLLGQLGLGEPSLID